MRKKMKFADGGDAPMDIKVDMDVGDVTKGAKRSLADSRTFGAAFRAAREAGDKTFTWRGKSYGTKLAGEGSSTPRRAPVRKSTPTPVDARRSDNPAPSSRIQQDYDRGAAMRKSLTPTSERVTPDMIAAVRRFAGPDVPAYNAFGDKPSAAQLQRQSEARARAAANWKKAGETVASGKKKGGSVKKSCGGMKYAKGGSVDGCAVRGKTRAKRTK